ncbi:MAG TPA: sugar transporter, partial [Flavobacterium sp.]|nr:sugar transporter [Flavobacterium sp.]
MKKLLFIAVLFFALTPTQSVVAQDLLKGQNLSTLKVDYLSDADLAKLRSQLQSNNMTIDQAEPMALAKGMSAAEFAKLKARLGGGATATKAKQPTEAPTDNEYTRKQEPIENKKVKDTLNALVFGSELF